MLAKLEELWDGALTSGKRAKRVASEKMPKAKIYKYLDYLAAFEHRHISADYAPRQRICARCLISLKATTSRPTPFSSSFHGTMFYNHPFPRSYVRTSGSYPPESSDVQDARALAWAVSQTPVPEQRWWQLAVSTSKCPTNASRPLAQAL